MDICICLDLFNARKVDRVIKIFKTSAVKKYSRHVKKFSTSDKNTFLKTKEMKNGRLKCFECSVSHVNNNCIRNKLSVFNIYVWKISRQVEVK